MCLAMLLFGGGIFPPMIRLNCGWVETCIHQSRNANSLLRLLFALWSWMLVLFSVLLFGQGKVGTISNDFRMWLMIPNLIVISAILVLSPLAASALVKSPKNYSASG
jgi:hypothetical protein